MTEFKEIKLNTLFKIEKIRGFNKNELITNYNGSYDYVTRTSLNNGVESITDKVPNRTINDPNTFSLGLLQMTFFYRERPWYAGQFVRKIVPQFKNNKYIMLYMLVCLRRVSDKLLSVLVRDVDRVFDEIKISLPVKSNGEIDFAYMEKYIKELEAERIKELEAERIKELEAYLITTGLNDYKLTGDEKQLLAYKPKFKEFKIGEIFEIKTSKKKLNASQVKFIRYGHPYVTRGDKNNGIRGNISFEEKYLNPKDTISFGQDTATMYYQPKAYFTGDKIKVLKLNNKFGLDLNPKIAMYLIGVMKKKFKNFVWGQQSFSVKVIADSQIKLPVTEKGQIDFAYMEKYIKAMQKVAIKDVVKYKDKLIATTKKVVND